MSHANSQASTRTIETFRPQARFDLEWIRYPSDHVWVARDPLTNEFYRFSEYEYAAVLLMDGSRSAAELLDEMKSRFGRIMIDLRWVIDLVQRLQSSMLLQPTLSSFRWLDKCISQNRSWHAWQLLRSPLSIRIPLFDPGPFLSWSFWPARMLFSTTVAVATMVTGLMALGLIVRWSMGHGLPQLNPARITIDRWLLLILCYVLVKSLHELGHMLACARFKVRASEVGVMLLCLMPCFYCDTTQAWRLPLKWQRIIISAAGIYVELIIAVFAALGWLFLKDGTISLVCLNFMAVCSISTIFVNANPLLRYDGYYILSDMWGVPNLHDQSRVALRSMFSRFVLLQPATCIPVDGNPLLLAIFAISSWVYRVFVMFAILWMVWIFLPPIGLQLVAVAITASTAVGIFASQRVVLKGAMKSFQAASAENRILMASIWSFIGVCIFGLLFLPLPSYVTTRGYVDYEDKLPIYATYDASIGAVANKYTKITAGSRVIQLHSPTAMLDLVKIEGEIQRVEDNLTQMNLRRTIDPETEYSIPQLEAELEQLRARQAVLARESSQLTFIAPTDGYLIDALAKPQVELGGFLESRFKASVLESENVNCWVNRGALLGWFSTLQRPLVVALVPEDAMNGIEVGDSALVRLDSNPFDPLKGEVKQIALDKVGSVSQALIGDQSLVSIPKAGGEFEPETAHYAVTILLEDTYKPLYESVATISFHVKTIPVHRHITDFVQRSLRPISK